MWVLRRRVARRYCLRSARSRRSLALEQIDLDGLLRRLHLPTIRRLYPELDDRAASEG